MTDIFTEVDEEVRREALAQMWKRYSNYVFAAVFLIIAGVAAWVAYNRWQDSKAAEAGAAFEAAAKLSDEGKHADAEAAFAKVAAEGTPGYQALARMRVASEIAGRDTAAGVAAYDKIASDMTGQFLFPELASVRAGALLVDTAKYDEMSRRLEPLTDPKGAFRHIARELLALSAWHNGDAAAARKWLDAARSDADAPQGVRQRMELLAAILPDAGK